MIVTCECGQKNRVDDKIKTAERKVHCGRCKRDITKRVIAAIMLGGCEPGGSVFDAFLRVFRGF